MPLFVKKEIASNEYFIDGNPVQFEILASDTGIGIFTDEKIIAGLKDAAEKRRGGIVIIDKETYEDLKKNKDSNPFLPRLNDRLRVLQSHQAKPVQKSATVSVDPITDKIAANSDPIKPGANIPTGKPEPLFKPRTGKKVKKAEPETV